MDDGPYAMKTVLAWTVNGPLGGDIVEGIDVATVDRISVLNLEELRQQQFKAEFQESSSDEQHG